MKSKPIKKVFNSKIFWMIISLICSVLLWAYVSDQEGTIVEKTYAGIRVEFEGSDQLTGRNLSIMKSDYSSVSIRVSGTRSELAKLNASAIKAVVDVSNITQPNEVELSYEIVFPNNVDANNITVLRKSPDTVNLTIVKDATKTVNIRASFDGEIAEGGVAEDIVIYPETVTVSGPEEILSKIEYAWVSFGENKTIESTYSVDTGVSFMDKDGNLLPIEETKYLNWSPRTVSVTQPILKTKEVPLSVNFIAGGGATKDDCVYTIEPQKTLKIAGDSEIVDKINSIEVGTIDLASFVYSDVYDFAITLPDGVQNIDGLTEVRVRVEIPGMHTKRFVTDNISVKNVTAGYSATIDTKELEITLRSSDPEVLAKISSKDISVVVDLKDYDATVGQVMAVAKVTVRDHENVGAVGDLRVTVTLSRD